MRILRRLLGRPARVGLVVVALVCLSPVAQAADDYPYKESDPRKVDPWHFYFRQCTSFVAFRMSQRGTFSNRMTGPNGVQGDWYNADNWDENARKLGFRVDSTPVRGAVAQWNGNEAGAFDLGHVAFVDQVNADGSVYVEEYNWTNPNGFSRRGPLRAPRYIHVYDDTAPPARQTTPQPVAPPPSPEVRVEEQPPPRHVTRYGTPSPGSTITPASASPPTNHPTGTARTRTTPLAASGSLPSDASGRRDRDAVFLRSLAGFSVFASAVLACCPGSRRRRRSSPSSPS